MNLDSARVKRVFGCGADGELLSSCVIVLCIPFIRFL